jgi:hypothetical protein
MEDEDAVVVQRTENADADQLEAMARDCLREATPEAFEACLQDIFKLRFVAPEFSSLSGGEQLEFVRRCFAQYAVSPDVRLGGKQETHRRLAERRLSTDVFCFIREHRDALLHLLRLLASFSDCADDDVFARKKSCDSKNNKTGFAAELRDVFIERCCLATLRAPLLSSRRGEVASSSSDDHGFVRPNEDLARASGVLRVARDALQNRVTTPLLDAGGVLIQFRRRASEDAFLEKLEEQGADARASLRRRRSRSG